MNVVALLAGERLCEPFDGAGYVTDFRNKNEARLGDMIARHIGQQVSRMELINTHWHAQIHGVWHRTSELLAGGLEK